MEGEDDFSSPSLAVDAVALRGDAASLEALLIRRGNPPWEGKFAFPGGFVDVGEAPEEAVLRELYEETGVSGKKPELFVVRGDPDRDPRKHVVSIFYLVEVDGNSIPEAGDDAAYADWVGLNYLRAEDVAGDHISVIEQLRK